MKNRRGSHYTRNKSQLWVFGNIKNPSKAAISFLAIFLPKENAFLVANSGLQRMSKPLKLGQGFPPPMPTHRPCPFHLSGQRGEWNIHAL